MNTIKSNKELENEINSNMKKVELHGVYELDFEFAKSIFFDGKFIKQLIQVKTGSKLVDGSDAEIILDIKKSLDTDLSVFAILKNIRNLKFINLNLTIRYTGPNCTKSIYAIHNTSSRFSLIDSEINYFSQSQANFVGIYNNGNLDTHLDTPADNLIIKDCKINIGCNAIEITNPCEMIGIHNNLANSISICENFIFVQNNGNDEKQRSIGIFNTGRFARIENNNIKANGLHNKGMEIEQAHSYGVYNTGLYMIFVGNNCIGEWGGKSVGLFNSGNFADITVNKILATHTVMGRSVIIDADNCILANNVLVSTSRNPHLVEVSGNFNNINSNFIQGLMAALDYRSGIGLLLGKENRSTTRNNITNNIISFARDFGILVVNANENIISNNQIVKFAEVDDFIGIHSTGKNQIKDNLIDPGNVIDFLQEKINRNKDENIKTIIEL